MEVPENVSQWLLPVVALTTGVAVGILAEFVIRRLKRMAARTRWEFDELLLRSLRGVVFVWCVLAGGSAALIGSPLEGGARIAGENALLVGFILSVTVLASRVVTQVISAYARGVESILPSTSIIANLVKLLIFLIGLLVIFQSLGISITPVLTALGVGGLAVALALQGTLSNLFSGVHLILSGKIAVGDYVGLDPGDEGYVEDITWRDTTIRSREENLIVIPNARLAETVIVNYSRPTQKLRLRVSAGVSYDSDLEHVERVTREVAGAVQRETPGCDPDFEPRVRFRSFDDSSIEVRVTLAVVEFREQFPVRSEMIKRLHARYREEGIVIPFPIRTVYLNRAEPPEAG